MRAGDPLRNVLRRRVEMVYPGSTDWQNQKGSRKGRIMPLVTIITPVFNAARWLPEALASVRAQTFTDWEHILVDDGSTDGSLAIVESAVAQDERFRSLPT